MDRPTPTGPAAPDLRIVESTRSTGAATSGRTTRRSTSSSTSACSRSYPTDTLPGFTDRLVELLPGLENHTCSKGVRGGFVERLREGTWLGHVSEHVALQLQQEAGHDQRRGKTRQVKGKHRGLQRHLRLHQRGGRPRGRSPRRAPAQPPGPGGGGLRLRRRAGAFLTRAERTAFGPSTGAILEEAVSRDIPFIRLNSGSLVQLGQGVHQQRIRATMTSKTSALAVDIAGDKDMTTRLLGSAGLPVPKQETVRSAEGAVAAARRIGFPVVVKPLDGNHGRGVCLDLQSDAEVREAFAVAEDQSRRGYVIVESMVTGRDYRCLIVGGRMQAIAERVPAHVIGDGTHTVGELVEITNSDPRRGVGHEKVLTKIKVDAAAAGAAARAGLRASTPCRPPTRWSSWP